MGHISHALLRVSEVVILQVASSQGAGGRHVPKGKSPPTLVYNQTRRVEKCSGNNKRYVHAL